MNTFASTGTGKGRGGLIVNLLSCEGPATCPTRPLPVCSIRAPCRAASRSAAAADRPRRFERRLP
ncbi:MAG: hypothetical protein WEA77_14485 [Hyphomonas sp.]|uniref:hypothetical protein n=1 Tax=Hyphomonas sp. TaxID=87 RepID=UPI00349FF136